MRARTTYPSHPGYQYYASRGITVCPEWQGPGGYTRFLADVGRKPAPEYWLERIDNDRGYEPGNVVWATPKAQCRNKGNNVAVEYRGEKRLLVEWCEELGLPYQRTYQRLFRFGWDPERAFTE